MLVQRGFDVDSVTHRADIPDNATDTQILEAAANEERAVITNNIKDFRPIAARRVQRGQGHGGLILVPSTRPRTKGANATLADAIERVMRENAAGLAGTERWLR